MSLQRMLGMMLASRMAGRGGMRGALGSGAMMRGLGRKRLGGKAGLLTLGYLAYQAYQGHQRNRAAGDRSGGSAPAGGGLGGAIGGIVDSLTGNRAGPSTATPHADRWRGEEVGPDEAVPVPEAEVGDEQALLLIRAMIAAANSDGKITPDERNRILSALDEAGADADDHRTIERELADPKPLDSLLPQVRDRETAQQFYLASRAAMDGSSRTQQAYLDYLRQRLDLPDEDVEEVESLTR